VRVEEASSMRKRVILSVLLLLAPAIILSGFGVGKYNVRKPAVADGSPIPPLPPNPSAISNTSLA